MVHVTSYHSKSRIWVLGHTGTRRGLEEEEVEKRWSYRRRRYPAGQQWQAARGT